MLTISANSSLMGPFDLLQKNRTMILINLLGLSTPTFATFRPCLHTLVLFSGPIVVDILTKTSPIPKNSSKLIYWRNYIVGPAVEEWVFRSCLVPLFVLAEYSESQIKWITPVFFSLGMSVHLASTPLFRILIGLDVAHAHHILTHLSQMTMVQAATSTLFQLIYTYFFGMYATHIFLLSKSFWACFACHVVCNVFGVPDLEKINEIGLKTRWIGWTAYGLGILGFWYGFWVLAP